MTCVAQAVLRRVEKNDEKFIITLPDWQNFGAYQLYKASTFLKNETLYKKGELGFIDHMNFKQIIHPCNIYQMTIFM